MHELKKTYDACRNEIGNYEQNNPLVPIFHTVERAHVTVTIDNKGNFLRSRYNDGVNDTLTILPCTEESQSRTSGYVPHTLTDAIMYLDHNSIKYLGRNLARLLDTYMIDEDGKRAGKKQTVREAYKAANEDYLNNLKQWAESKHTHPAIQSVYAYIQKQTLLADIQDILEFIKDWDQPQYTKDENVYVFIYDKKTEKPRKENRELRKVMVRWEIQNGDKIIQTWKDHAVFKSWTDYYMSIIDLPEGFCMVTGETTKIAKFFQRNLTRGGDQRKIISSNTNDDFKDRFHKHTEAYSMGIETAYETHNALRYLFGKQGYNRDTFAFVAWRCGTGETIDVLNPQKRNELCDTMEPEAKAINKTLSAKEKPDGNNYDINALCLDSTCKGRFSISFYDKYPATEFAKNIKSFYDRLQQECFNKEFVPSIGDILYYGYIEGSPSKSTKKNHVVVFKKMVHAMLQGKTIPTDIVSTIVNKAYSIKKNNPILIATACSVYNQAERRFGVALDKTCNDRSYLFGRLVAVADVLERDVLTDKKEKRETNVIRYFRAMQQTPFTTWSRIEGKLAPYKAYLARKLRDVRYDIVFNEIFDIFDKAAFESDESLTANYLMGYHHQKSLLYKKKNITEETAIADEQKHDKDEDDE